MTSQKIMLKTETGQSIEVEVLSMRADRIEVLLGEEMRCTLTPTRNQLAYAGQIRGREVIYEKRPADVRAELARRDPHRRRIR